MMIYEFCLEQAIRENEVTNLLQITVILVWLVGKMTPTMALEQLYSAND
jgi:hypothetical protein